VDDDDISAFELCAKGPTIPLDPGCEDKDLDGDGDGDQDDFGTLQRCISGAGVPATCMPDPL
jgi:hypothetical protein